MGDKPVGFAKNTWRHNGSTPRSALLSLVLYIPELSICVFCFQASRMHVVIHVLYRSAQPGLAWSGFPCCIILQLIYIEYNYLINADGWYWLQLIIIASAIVWVCCLGFWLGIVWIAEQLDTRSIFEIFMEPARAIFRMDCCGVARHCIPDVVHLLGWWWEAADDAVDDADEDVRIWMIRGWLILIRT